MALAFTVEQRHMTAEEFDAWAARPENHDTIAELIQGELIEVPSNALASLISSLILTFLNAYALQHKIGYVTGEAGGYMVHGERFAPDVAFVSKAKQTLPVAKGYNPIPPDLAVEVDYPTTPESAQRLRFKLWAYLSAGTVVWLVVPEQLTVEVHAPGQPPRLLGIKDTLEGGDLLPGFTLPVANIFPEEFVKSLTQADQSTPPTVEN